MMWTCKWCYREQNHCDETHNGAIIEFLGEVNVLSEQKVMLMCLILFVSQTLAFEPFCVNKYMVRVIIIGLVWVWAFEIFLHVIENLDTANACVIIKTRKLRKRVSLQNTQI